MRVNSGLSTDINRKKIIAARIKGNIHFYLTWSARRAVHELLPPSEKKEAGTSPLKYALHPDGNRSHSCRRIPFCHPRCAGHCPRDPGSRNACRQIEGICQIARYYGNPLARHLQKSPGSILSSRQLTKKKKDSGLFGSSFCGKMILPGRQERVRIREAVLHQA